MNKKILAALCGILVSGAAVADDVRFYVGADLGYNSYKKGADINDAQEYFQARNVNTNFKTRTPTFGVLAGLRYCENFGAELGYTFFKKTKLEPSANGITIDGKLKQSNMYADLLGYLPVCDQFEAIGSIGLGRASVKETLTSATLGLAGIGAAAEPDTKTNKIGFRLGLGGQYKIDDNFAVRAMVRFQKVGKKGDDELVKRNTSFNLGVTYTI